MVGQYLIPFMIHDEKIVDYRYLNGKIYLVKCKYNNYEMTSYRIENKNISNIRFTLYNEKRQKLNLDNMLLHFEIEKLRLN